MTPEEAIKELQTERYELTAQGQIAQDHIEEIDQKLVQIERAFIELKLKNNICKHIALDGKCMYPEKSAYYNCEGNLANCAVEEYKV